MKNKGIKLLITAVLMSCVVGVQAQEQASPLNKSWMGSAFETSALLG